MDTWHIYFASILSIQFHPKNGLLDKEWEDIKLIIAKSAIIADEAKKLEVERCQSYHQQ